jgi:hypothetical protein
VEPAQFAGVRCDRLSSGERRGRVGKVSAEILHDTEVIPDAVDGTVDGAAAREVGERAIEFTDGKVSMPAPSGEQRIIRLDLEPSRERRDGFAKLPCTGLRNAEVDDATNVCRVGSERGLRGLDGFRIGKRAILHALG